MSLWQPGLQELLSYQSRGQEGEDCDSVTGAVMEVHVGSLGWTMQVNLAFT